MTWDTMPEPNAAVNFHTYCVVMDIKQCIQLRIEGVGATDENEQKTDNNSNKKKKKYKKE